MFATEPEWTSEDAVATRSFLETKHGQRFLQRLLWLRPDFSSKRSDATQRLVESGDLEGYERCFRTILTLQEESKPIKEENNYPDLDNDAEWNDAEIARQNSTQS